MELVELKRLKILGSEVLLEELGEGKGKIIINSSFGNFSHYWGSMGDDLETFIKNIDSYYFAGKLCNNMLCFSGKATAKNIRRFIKEELGYELPWYKYMSGQKELRKEIKKLETCENEYLALNIIENFHNIICYDLSWDEEKEFLKIIEDVFKQEPWNFLEKNYSDEYQYLVKLHKKLIKKL